MATNSDPDVTDVDDDVVRILIALRHLQQVSADVNARAAERLGLSRSQFQAVAHLSVHRSTTSGDLGEALNLSPGGVTALVDQLIRLGHVERQPGADRRQVIIALTTGGMAAANTVGVAYWHAVAEGVPAARRGATLEVLDDLGVALGRLLP